MGVCSNGYGYVSAVTNPKVYNENRNGNAYSAIVSVTPTGADDCFFYIKNNDAMDMLARIIRVRSASAESIQIKLGDTGTVGGTHADLTPVSRNAGSGKIADVTCESGVDITGLSGGSIVDIIYCNTTQVEVVIPGDLIVPKNSIISFYAVTGAVALNLTFGFYFDSSSC